MENKDLGSKKMNNKQNVNEGFSGENMSEEKNPSAPILKTEVEIDVNGNPVVVQRARNIDATTNTPEETDRNWNENESLSRGVTTEEEVDKTIENKDRNSDITPNRYPNSNPDNHENRGNIKLDEK
ncbi:MAG: hypothetical protein ABWZ56_09120 [Flavobacterium sp.]